MNLFRTMLQSLGGHVAVVVVAIATALIGVAWLSFALYSALDYDLGPVMAAAITGAVALMPLVIVTIAFRHQPKAPQGLGLFEDVARADWRGLAASLSQSIESLAKQKPLEAIVVFLILGFAAARSPHQLLEILNSFLQPSGDSRDT